MGAPHEPINQRQRELLAAPNLSPANQWPLLWPKRASFLLEKVSLIEATNSYSCHCRKRMTTKEIGIAQTMSEKGTNKETASACQWASRAQVSEQSRSLLESAQLASRAAAKRRRTARRPRCGLVQSCTTISKQSRVALELSLAPILFDDEIAHARA